MLPALLKTMLSFDRPLPLTPTECFTQWSSLAYVLVGSSMLLTPSLWGHFWNAELVGRTAGYIQLAGLSLAVEGFLLVVASRSFHKVRGHGHINITVVTRLVLVNLSLWKAFEAGVAPRRYIAFFAVVDNSLAVGIFLVWIFTERGATLGLFFKEIFTLAFRLPSGHRSSFAVVAAGIVQFLGALYLKNVDLRLRGPLNLDPRAEYSDIFLSLYFSLHVAHAVLYIFNGQAVSRSFNISCVFYRVVINLPVISLLAVAYQVEKNLAVFLVCVEAGFTAFILVFLLFDKYKGDQEEEEGKFK